MSNRTAISTINAPTPVGAYSQAVIADKSLYISGQLPLIPETGDFVAGGDMELIEQCFKNIDALCKESGGTLADIVRLTVYLTDLSLTPTLNKVMEKMFNAPFPARVTIGVASLPMASRVEVDAIAYLPQL